MALFGSAAARRRLRTVATALVAALAVTLLSIVEGPDDGAVASDSDRFPLAVRAELTHLAGAQLSISLGSEAAPLDGGPSRRTRIDGNRHVSGLVQVTDDTGRLVGTAVVPKDEVALLGLYDDGPLEIPVTYRSTAFSLFALQPGIASTEPTVTVLIAALVMDLPEMEALTAAVAEAARSDPAYLEDLSPEVDQALEDLLAAFDRRVNDVEADIGGQVRVPTTQSLAPPTRQPVADPDGCGNERDDDVLVIDTASQDHVCVTDADFNGSTWHVGGRSSTPRWAVARAVNRGVPADHLQIVPGKALSIPSLEALAFDLGESMLLGQLDTALNVGIHLCNGAAWLIGRRCGDPDRPGTIERFIDQVQGYFSDAEFSFELNGSEATTVLSIDGLGAGPGNPPAADVVISWLTTLVMTVIVPGIGIFIDVREIVLVREDEPFSPQLIRSLVDTAATLVPVVTRFIEEIQAGGMLDRLGSVVNLAKEVIRTTIDSGLLLALLREFFQNAQQAPVARVVRTLSENLATAPVKWIDLGIDVVNAGVTMLMLIDDYPELYESARYGLGYAEPPEDPPAYTGGSSVPIPSEPLENPGLPTESCGLRVAVVLDVSASIPQAGGEATDQVREAASGLVDAFGGTATSVRMSTFAGAPATRLGWTSLAFPEGRRTAGQAAEGIDFDDGLGPGSGTNWEAALIDVLGDDADLVVFVTDGNPNRLGSGVRSRSDAGTVDFDPNALAAGVDAANTLKSNGTRVVAVGVGDVNVDPLRQVSGPTQGQDYFLGDFDALAASLSSVADEVCGAALVIEHLVDGAPSADAVYNTHVYGGIPEQLVTAADGKARLEYEPPTDDVEQAPNITVTWPVGPLEEATCQRAGEPIDDLRRDPSARNLTFALHGVVTCTFSWRGLTGADSALAEIVNGPGEILAVSFTPIDSVQGKVIGCFGPICANGGFGVSYSDGFAVLRYDPACLDCAPIEAMVVTAEDNGVVHFVLDLGSRSSGPAIELNTADLDVTVESPATATPVGPVLPAPGLSGIAGARFPIDIRYVLSDPPANRCLFVRGADDWSLAQDNTIRVGAGC